MIREFNGRAPVIAGSAFVSEAACIIGDVHIGERSNIWPLAVIRADLASIRLGDYVIVEDGSVLHARSDMVVGSDVVIGHGAVVHCSRIGNMVLVGMNATVLEDAEIGDMCVIAAGSVVPEGFKVRSGSLVAGIPGKVIGPIPAAFREWAGRHSEVYPDLAAQYRVQGL